MNIVRHVCAAAGCTMIFMLAAGCGKSPAPEAAAIENTGAPAELLSVFRPVIATGPVLPIPELRNKVSPGDKVMIEAKVMGTLEPFVESRALFVVGDEGTLITCDLEEGDTCKTPWDACCEPPEELRVGTATIQVVDANGAVLKHSIREINGLKELSRVRIEGVVAPQSSAEALIINATGIQLL